jgi:hypothetical protein
MRPRDGEDGLDYLGAVVFAKHIIETISCDAKYDESEQRNKTFIFHPLCQGRDLNAAWFDRPEEERNNYPSIARQQSLLSRLKLL